MIIFFLLFHAVAGLSLKSAEMDKLNDVHLANGDVFSGDEFLVTTKDSILHLKLYLAECPHLSCLNKLDSLHLEYLSYYWGLTNSDTLFYFAKVASEYTRKILAQPFTVYTKYQPVIPGCDSIVYAIIKTAAGEFLSYLLLENGLARIGSGNTAFSENSNIKNIEAEIRDREIKAILQRNGIWACSDPERLIKLRSEIRMITAAQETNQTNVPVVTESNSLKDINTATIEELQVVKGLGPKTAQKIVDGRPYQSMDDLLKVKGIGPKTLEKIKEHFVVQEASK